MSFKIIYLIVLLIKHTLSSYYNISKVNLIYITYTYVIFIRYNLIFYLTDFENKSYSCSLTSKLHIIAAAPFHMLLEVIRDLPNIFISLFNEFSYMLIILYNYIFNN